MRRRTLARLGGAALGLAALLIPGSAGAAEPADSLPVLEAKVTKVNDGDSIEVTLGDGKPARVRLSAVDTPEYDQPYGAQASAALKSMLAAGNSAYDNFNKVARQATEIAEANVSAATETVKGLAKAKKAA